VKLPPLDAKTLAYFGVLLAGLSVFYSMVVAPEIGAWRTQRCIDRAQETGLVNWKRACVELGKPLGTDGSCAGLPEDQARLISESAGAAKDRCVEQYKR